MNPSVKDALNARTGSAFLPGGKEALVTEMRAGVWLVTMLGVESPKEFRHDASTGKSWCECGAELSCDHRTAVWRVFERKDVTR